MRYDRDGDQHYDVISAFIKSVRGSDVDAALHYLARMLVAGEDPRFIARRLVILASEDIGMADPTALQIAVAAAQTVQLIGMPEAQLTLAHATVHLATAPKSNAVTTALAAAMDDIKAGKAGLVPAHLRDGHYSGAAALGNAQGYKYSHDDPDGVVAQQYPPDELVGVDYYRPTGRGGEREIAGRLDRLRAIIRRNALGLRPARAPAGARSPARTRPTSMISAPRSRARLLRSSVASVAVSGHRVQAVERRARHRPPARGVVDHQAGAAEPVETLHLRKHRHPVEVHGSARADRAPP